MEPFKDVGLEVDDVLEAIVLGGNVLQSRTGAKKRRRKVPAKQAKLVRLVATNGLVTFDQLVEAFPREWRAVEQRRVGQPLLARKRELFRNIADLAKRVNEALAAGYQERQAATRMLGMTGGRYLEVSADPAALEASWTSAARPGKAGGAPRREAKEEEAEAKAEPTADEPEAAGPEPKTNEGEPTKSSGETAPLRGEGSAGKPRASEEPPAPEEELEEVLVHEDPVTGIWRFDLHGQSIEVDRNCGFIRIDGELLDSELVRGLEHVEDLRGDVITWVIQYVEGRKRLLSLES